MLLSSLLRGDEIDHSYLLHTPLFLILHKILQFIQVSNDGTLSYDSVKDAVIGILGKVDIYIIQIIHEIHQKATSEQVEVTQESFIKSIQAMKTKPQPE